MNTFHSIAIIIDPYLFFFVDLTDEILHSILKRGCHELRSLDLSASPNRLTNYSLELIGNQYTSSDDDCFTYFYPPPCIKGMYCPNLENLDISGVKVTQTSFKQLTLSCLKLKV